MKKVAIFTLNDDYNCGCRLQNYAVQTCLERHGCRAETIRIGKWGIKAILKDWIKRLAYERNKADEFIDGCLAKEAFV